jgi:hypothetical protein
MNVPEYHSPNFKPGERQEARFMHAPICQDAHMLTACAVAQDAGARAALGPGLLPRRRQRVWQSARLEPPTPWCRYMLHPASARCSAVSCMRFGHAFLYLYWAVCRKNQRPCECTYTLVRSQSPCVIRRAHPFR